MAGQVRQQMKPVAVPPIERVPIDEIIENPANPRTHSPAQIARIADSIREFGFLAPVVLRGRMLVAGHGRLMAARRAGMREVPAVQADHLSDDQARAFMIADNQLGDLSGWNDDLLREAMAALQDAGLQYLTGFDDADLQRILGESAEYDGQDDDFADMTRDPSIKITLSVPGEVWLGNRERIIETLEKASKKFMLRIKIDE